MIRFKSNNKYYHYDQRNGIIYKSDKVTEVNDPFLKEASIKVSEQIRARGYDSKMDFQSFENYISCLRPEEKNELFHRIYDGYLYVNDWVNVEGKGKPSPSEFEKGLSKLKRWESYLNIILNS